MAKENDNVESQPEEKKSGFRRKLKFVLLGIATFFVLLVVFLDVIIHVSVEKIVPKAIGVPVTMEDIDVSILRGHIGIRNMKVGDSSGLNAENFIVIEKIDVFLRDGNAEVKNVFIANPEGFSEKHLLKLEYAKLDLDTDTLSAPKLRIEEFTLTGLDVFYEPSVTGKNNIEMLEEYVQKTFNIPKEDPAAETPQTEAKKLQVDDLNLKDISVHTVVLGQRLTLPVIPIEEKELGTGPEGITSGEVLLVILDNLSAGAVKAVNKEVSAFGANLKESSQKTYEDTKQGIKKNVDSLINVFK